MFWDDEKPTLREELGYILSGSSMRAPHRLSISVVDENHRQVVSPIYTIANPGALLDQIYLTHKLASLDQIGWDDSGLAIQTIRLRPWHKDPLTIKEVVKILQEPQYASAIRDAPPDSRKDLRRAYKIGSLEGATRQDSLFMLMIESAIGRNVREI